MKKKLLATVLVSSQLLAIAGPIMNNTLVVEAFNETEVDLNLPEGADTENYIERFEKYVDEETYSEELGKEIKRLFDKSKDLKDIKKIRKIIDEFTDLHQLIDREDAGHYLADGVLLGMSDAEKTHNNIVTAINKYGKNKDMLLYANKLIIGYTKDASGFSGLYELLSAKNRFGSIEDELEYGRNVIELFDGRVQAGYEEKLEVFIKDGKLKAPEYDKSKEDDTGLPSGGESVPEDDNFDDIDDDIISSGDKGSSSGSAGTSLPERTESYYEYDAKKGQRILVTRTTKNGKTTETRTVEASGLTSMWSDQLGSALGGAPTDNDNTIRKEKEEKRLSLQYTLNKDDEFPSYVDSGIFLNDEGMVDYDALYDVLYQIAVNVDKGFLVEDSDKLLIVVEGKPIYILESDKEYSPEEVEKIFEDFTKVELLVKETRIGTTDTLEWQLRTGKEQKLVVDGDEINLKTQPKIRGEKIVLPIVETLEAIGAEIEETEEEDNKIIINYKDNVIELEHNVSEARINGDLVDLGTPVAPNKQGIFTTDIMPIFDSLKVESEWDEQESTLSLNGTRRKEMLKEKKEKKEKEDKAKEKEKEKEEEEDK